MKPDHRTGLRLLEVPPRVEASLWRRLRFEAEVRCRELIFNRYIALARSIAAVQRRTRPRHGVELNDMEQFAYEGLLYAIDRFDPLKGVPFAAFARRRIAGSVSDGASQMNEVDAHYSHRRRQELERARSVRAGADTRKEDGLQALATLATGLAIGLILAETGMVQPEDGADHRPSAYDTLAWRELQSVLAREVAKLPERHAMILRQHYQNGVSFTQIATLLGVTKGRVSQLHAEALSRLRRRIGPRG